MDRPGCLHPYRDSRRSPRVGRGPGGPERQVGETRVGDRDSDGGDFRKGLERVVPLLDLSG